MTITAPQTVVWPTAQADNFATSASPSSAYELLDQTQIDENAGEEDW